MNLAQTNLSKLAENRPALTERLDCGVFSAAFPRLLLSRRAKSGDESPQSRRYAPFAAFAGARASARFNVHCGATQEVSGPLPIRELKRRERRAPNENRAVEKIFSRRECGPGLEK